MEPTVVPRIFLGSTFLLKFSDIVLIANSENYKYCKDVRMHTQSNITNIIFT